MSLDYIRRVVTAGFRNLEYIRRVETAGFRNLENIRRLETAGFRNLEHIRGVEQTLGIFFTFFFVLIYLRHNIMCKQTLYSPTYIYCSLNVCMQY